MQGIIDRTYDMCVVMEIFVDFPGHLIYYFILCTYNIRISYACTEWNRRIVCSMSCFELRMEIRDKPNSK